MGEGGKSQTPVQLTVPVTASSIGVYTNIGSFIHNADFILC